MENFEHEAVWRRKSITRSLVVGEDHNDYSEEICLTAKIGSFNFGIPVSDPEHPCPD